MKIGVGPLWVEAKPFKKWRERRAAKRAAKNAEVLPETGEERGMRTSTNAGIAGIVVNILLQVLQWIPATADLGASPEVAAGLTAIAMWIVARMSKTPANPGVL